nr:GtrA family protein [Lacticaseibacillus absianus]
MQRWLSTHGWWAPLLYLFFGGLTTGLNLVSFAGLRALGASWPLANLCAWGVAVLVAFVTNKYWVFRSRGGGRRQTFGELGAFVAARVASLGLDYACMWGLISVMGLRIAWAKGFTQILIVVANYGFSKLVIFRTTDHCSRPHAKKG